MAKDEKGKSTGPGLSPNALLAKVVGSANPGTATDLSAVSSGVNAKEPELEATGTEAVSSDAPPSAPPRVGGPALDVEQVAVQAEYLENVFLPETKPTETYWIGTIRQSPFQNYAIGGHCFPYYTEEQSPMADGGTDRVKRFGALVKLDEDQVRRIKEEVARMVVRDMGSRKYTLYVDKPGYVRNVQRDVPIARYIYMVKVQKNMPLGWREFEPPTMLRPKV